ncbi:hypothetical protein C8R43DRAFT_978844 [Mycena crocata]|nr:hypothetical protein C8R43DRAFT_978844 [Mycena crocata]
MASSSRSPDSTETGECHAYNEQFKQECTCPVFREFMQTGICADCFHNRNSHFKLTGKGAEKVQDIMSRILGPSGPSSSSTGGSATTLTSISKARKLLSMSGASSSRTKAANSEANKGMRPGRVEVVKGKGKGKETETRSGSESRTNSDLFKVASIFILHRGTKFIGEKLQIPAEYNSIPDKVQIQSAQSRGLAVVDSSKGITLNRTWTHDELRDALHDLLPLAFPYFDRIQNKSQDDGPVWYLGGIAKRQLAIVETAHPTGADVDYHKGGGTTGWRNDRVWIGMS